VTAALWHPKLNDGQILDAGSGL